MADPLFFKNHGPFTVKAIADLTGTDVQGNSDISLEDVAPLQDATSNQLSFFDNKKYLDAFKQTKAGACFVNPVLAEQAPDGVTLLVSPNPYKAYALAAQAFYPKQVHSAQETVIEEGAIVKEGAEIADGSLIEAGAVIGENVIIGKNCRIGPNAVISHSIIGNHVHIYPGAMIGQDGFGFAIDPAGFVKVPQLGRVLIEDHVNIGANTTIDRGAGPDTVIGAGTWIDNLVQIGHNVKIGKGCVIVAQVGVSGSTEIEDYVMIGGQVGVAGHLRIGSGSRIAAQSGIMRNVKPGQELMGSPAIPQKDFMRQVVALKGLIKKDKSS